MTLSVKQKATFWKAWAAVKGERQDLSAAELETLRHQTIKETTGKSSLTKVAHLEQFESLMAEVCRMGNNIEGACYWAIGSDRRVRVMVERCACQLAQIADIDDKSPEAIWAYVRGIAQQAKLPERLDDIAEPDLFKVFQMLDTHRRRKLEPLLGKSVTGLWDGDHSIVIDDPPAPAKLGFNKNAGFFFLGGYLVMVTNVINDKPRKKVIASFTAKVIPPTT